MKWLWCLPALAVVACPAWAQDAPHGMATLEPPVLIADVASVPVPVPEGAPDESDEGGFLTGERSFPGFIGYLSNPELAIDPRSLTQFEFLYAGTWLSGKGLLPGGDVQVLGPPMDVALSERLSVGVNRGGYVFAHFDKDREGWLDIGGFVQYELIRDVPDQFLVTLGLGVETPTGSTALFQGNGPAYLAPYITAAKEFGNFHVLTTFGYQFPTGPGTLTTKTFYGTVHLDRCCFGWLYPVLEFNWAASSRDFSLDLGHILDHLGFDPSADGTLVTVAPGINAVLIRNRLEVGVAYQTPIGSKHDLSFNEVLVKIVMRY